MNEIFTYPKQKGELTNSKLQRAKYDEVYLGREGKYLLKNMVGKPLKMISHNNSNGSFYVKCPDGYTYTLKIKNKTIYEETYNGFKKTNSFKINGKYLVYNSKKDGIIDNGLYKIEIKISERSFMSKFLEFLKKQNIPEFMKVYKEIKSVADYEDLFTLMHNKRNINLETALGLFLIHNLEIFETDNFTDLPLETKEQILYGLTISDKRKDGDLENIYYFSSNFMNHKRLVKILSHIKIGEKDNLFLTEIKN